MHSTKPVDEIGPAVFQLTESARMPMINLFLDFSNPEVSEKSQDLIKMMEDLAPQFNERFKFYWTDEPA